MSERTKPFSVRFGRQSIDFSVRPYIMGILNVTPDSFSDGGCFSDPPLAAERGLQMCDEGADFIDIGGESSRPGARGITAKEEIRRIIPVLKLLRRQIKKHISIDTTKADVAEAALDEGADCVNDISALTRDKRLGKVIAAWNIPVVLMHMKGRNARDMQRHQTTDDVIEEISRFFQKALCRAHDYNISESKILLDPGMGFGKKPEHNLKILMNLKRFLNFKRPLMIGASRKSFIGQLCDGEDASHRLPGSLASAVISCMQGVHVYRVHDVSETRQALCLTSEVMKHHINGGQIRD